MGQCSGWGQGTRRTATKMDNFTARASKEAS